jgi:hypothetical protein
MHEGMAGGMCKCPHHKAIPLFIVLIGVVFLLQALGMITAQFAGIAWPVLIILIGLQKMFAGMCKCCAPKM